MEKEVVLTRTARNRPIVITNPVEPEYKQFISGLSSEQLRELVIQWCIETEMHRKTLLQRINHRGLKNQDRRIIREFAEKNGLTFVFPPDPEVKPNLDGAKKRRKVRKKVKKA